MAYSCWFIVIFVALGYELHLRDTEVIYYVYTVPKNKVEVEGIDILPRTLWNIAKTHGVSVERLKKANRLEGDTITPGQKVIVPVPKKMEALVSWYGPGFHGRKTAEGKIFDQEDVNAVAHPSLPMGTKVKISGVPAIVKDRGPYPHYLMTKLNTKYEPRTFDASHGLAKKIGFDLKGVANLLVEIEEIPGSFPTLEEAREEIRIS